MKYCLQTANCYLHSTLLMFRDVEALFAKQDRLLTITSTEISGIWEEIR